MKALFLLILADENAAVNLEDKYAKTFLKIVNYKITWSQNKNIERYLLPLFYKGQKSFLVSFMVSIPVLLKFIS